MTTKLPKANYIDIKRKSRAGITYRKAVLVMPTIKRELNRHGRRREIAQANMQ